VNPVRQKSQAVIKSNLEEIGIEVQLESIDSSIFFDTAVGNDQNYAHFYWDMNMLQSVPNSPRSMQSMETWYAGPDRENLAQASNGWAGQNTSRYVSEEYDAAFEAARTATDADELAAQFIAMNDILVNNFVIVPLVVAGEPRAISKRLRAENIALGPFSGDYWNIANWNLSE
jgi:peptide/nickel transport system substrate-binding protein